MVTLLGAVIDAYIEFCALRWNLNFIELHSKIYVL